MSSEAEQVRTFLAIRVPPWASEVLAGCIRQLSDQAPQGVRWVDPSGIHLTLRFLGNIPVRLVEDVLAAQQSAVQAVQPFTLELVGLGAFPNLQRPRVVWAGVSGDTEALGRLQQSVERELESVGFPPDRRPFSPHLTLGRVGRQASKTHVDKITAAISSVSLGSPCAWLVEESHLIKSTLTPQGAIYTSLGSAGLAVSSP